MYYVKKPIPIEAVQLPNPFTIEWFQNEAPQWLVDGDVVKTIEGFIIPTLEGKMLCPWGSYIIKGIKGELYPCRKEVFEESYEPISD